MATRENAAVKPRGLPRSIHKNELARAMFEGTQRALAEVQQKQAQGSALPEPEVKSYGCSDMKPLFNRMASGTDLAVAR
jgi:hypothetical protein